MERGSKTSEFWLVVAGIAATLINGTEFVNIPWDQFSVVVVGLIGSYTGGRSLVKAFGKGDVK